MTVRLWGGRCVTRQVDPPIKVDGWGPAGELRMWLLVEDGWWGLVAGRDGVRWIRRGSPPVSIWYLTALGTCFISDADQLSARPISTLNPRLVAPKCISLKSACGE